MSEVYAHKEMYTFRKVNKATETFLKDQKQDL